MMRIAVRIRDYVNCITYQLKPHTHTHTDEEVRGCRGGVVVALEIYACVCVRVCSTNGHVRICCSGGLALEYMCVYASIKTMAANMLHTFIDTLTDIHTPSTNASLLIYVCVCVYYNNGCKQITYIHIHTYRHTHTFY